MFFVKGKYSLRKFCVKLLICFYFSILLISMGCDNNRVKDNTNDKESFSYLFIPAKNTITIDSVQEFYGTIKDTKPSEHSKAILEIINKREKCYFDENSIEHRLSECKKQYLFDIITYAKENIDSSPEFGKFVHCVSTCPAITAVCKGERIENCSEIEEQCIELCLDLFWRGCMRYKYKK